MAKVRVDVDEQALAEFVETNRDIKDLLLSVGNNVKSAAEATAQDAQGGPGGRLSGYAEAGFSVVWESRGRRPRVLIVSNADSEMATRVHLSTIVRWGIGHMRKALRDGVR